MSQKNEVKNTHTWWLVSESSILFISFYFNFRQQSLNCLQCELVRNNRRRWKINEIHKFFRAQFSQHLSLKIKLNMKIDRAYFIYCRFFDFIASIIINFQHKNIYELLSIQLWFKVSLTSFISFIFIVVFFSLSLKIEVFSLKRKWYKIEKKRREIFSFCIMWNLSSND